jgi:hypothetical protein
VKKAVNTVHVPITSESGGVSFVRSQAYSGTKTGNPSIPLKSASRLTSVAPKASAVAAIHRSFSSNASPQFCRATLIAAYEIGGGLWNSFTMERVTKLVSKLF